MPKSAWLLLHKLRRAMVAPDRSLLEDLVEIDEATLPLRTKQEPPTGGQGRSPQGKMRIAGAVELSPEGEPRRIRLAPIGDFSACSLHAFVAGTSAPGARVTTDGWSGHGGLSDHDHAPKIVGTTSAHLVLRWSHRVFSNLKRWALGTSHGLRRPHLRRYLDEFVFRWNRRRHTAGGRGGRIWRYFRAAHAHRGHAGGTGGLAKRPDGFRRRIPHLGVRAGKATQSTGCYAVAAGTVAMVLPQSAPAVDPLTSYLIGVAVFLAATLTHEIMARRQVTRFMEGHAGLADHLVFELSQADPSHADEAVVECMNQLAGLGFRFSLDSVDRLNLDWEGFARRYVRFVKVPASLLLSDGRAAGAELHPADLKEVLGRNQIDLIAERIEDERTVVELLDYQVDFGQGFLFGAPRPSPGT